MTYTGSMWQIESDINLVSSCTDVSMARLRDTSSTVAHRSPMLQAGNVSGQPHIKHSLCRVQQFGTLCLMTFVHSRTMCPSMGL